MEIHELLSKSGVTISSSSATLKSVITKLNAGTAPKTACAKLLVNITQPGGETVSGYDAFIIWLSSNKELFKDMGVADATTLPGLVAILSDVVKFKSEYAAKQKKKVVDSSVTKPDYTMPGQHNGKNALELFTTTFHVEPNEFDRDLFSCFAVMGEHVAFNSDGKCYMLMTKTTNGRAQIVFNAGDGSANGVIKDITDAISVKWQMYFSKLVKLVSALPEYTDEDEEGSPIEEIFLHQVPSVMRHVVDVRKSFIKEGKVDYFKRYKVVVRKTEMSEPTASEFIDWIARNWVKATRNSISSSGRFLAWSNDPSELAVNHFVIWPREQWEHASLPAHWKAFLEGKASARLLWRLFFYIGAILDASNTAQQYLAISDAGQTGKGVIAEVLAKILPANSLVHVDNVMFNDEDKFSLSNVRIWNYHVGVINEYDGRSINSEKGKSIIGGDCQNLELKYVNSVAWEPRGFHFIVPSNRGFVLKEHSLRRRCIPLTFKATHCSVDNYNADDKQKLVDEGQDFLKFCWRVYQQSPLRQKDGGYFVACPEDEELYKAGKWIVETDELDKAGNRIKKPVMNDFNRYLRAFSKDPEIAEYYTVDDYEDTDLSEDFRTIIEAFFDETTDEEQFAKNTVFFELVPMYIDNVKAVLRAFGGAMTSRRYSQDTAPMIEYRSKEYRMFAKFLANHGHRIVHKHGGNVIEGYAFKKKFFNPDGTFVVPTRPLNYRSTAYENSNDLFKNGQSEAELF